MDHSKLSSLFNQFRIECIWLRECYNTHSTLFDRGTETDKLLQRAAHSFFQDISRVLQEYCIQKICSLTDPPRSLGKPNLSIRAINAGLSDLGLISTAISNLSVELHRYRDLIVDARNKLISHLDQSATLSGATLGAHPQAEVPLFFENLQKYCDEVGTVLGVGPLDFRSSPALGDAADLLRVLRNGVGR